MFRRSLPSYTGMLFCFSEERQRNFYMRNTFVGLSIMFIDSNGFITAIYDHAEPESETFCSGLGHFALEAPEGWCAQHGVKIGDRVKSTKLLPSKE